MFSVYCHTNKGNGKVYIGITQQDPKRRWLNGTGYSKNKKFQKDIDIFGWNGFEHRIIADGLTEEQAVAIEQELIKAYDSCSKGYNISKGGKYVNKRSLSHTANLIANGLRGDNISKEFKQYLDLFEKAELEGGDYAEVLNIHCKHAVEEALENWDSPCYNDECFLAQVLYNLKRNIMKTSYYKEHDSLEGFSYPKFWEAMANHFNGLSEVM